MWPVAAAASLLAAGGCGPVAPSDAAGEPRPAPAGSEARGRDEMFPWLLVEVPVQDLRGLLDYIAATSGYLRVVAAEADPPWSDPLDAMWIGSMNPNTREMDVDGDGRIDFTGDMDTFAIATSGMNELPHAGLRPSEANRGTSTRVGVVGYDVLGNIFVQSWADSPVVLTGEEPAFVRLPPLPSPGALTPCYDGVDQDQDGWIDLDDPDCRQGGPLIEGGPRVATCNDGVDNDGDGLSDALDDGCHRGDDLSELPSCEDGLDDDGDTWFDAADPDCALPGGREVGFTTWSCNDGLDGDLDGFIDAMDDSCAEAASAQE